MKQQLIYTITLKEGDKIFTCKATKNYQTALTIFRRKAKQIAGLATDIFTHTTVILNRNGKKIKSVHISTKFY